MSQHLIIDPVFTPYNPDGSVNAGLVQAQAALAKANGVNAVFVCGTTGESLSLSVAERKQIAEAWKKFADPSIKVFIQVGCQALPDAKELAAHAQSIGVDGIAAFSPSYFRPANVQTLVQFMNEISLAAPKLDFYYYHFPGLTGVNISVYDFLKEGSGKIAKLKGAKFTHIDMEDLSKCIALEGGRFDIWTGYGLTMGLPAIVMGARGSFFYTFLVPLFKELLQKYSEGKLDEAAKVQHKMVEINTVMSTVGGVPAGKLLYNHYVDTGDVRLPLSYPSPQVIEKYLKEMNAVFPLPSKK
eukprot:TRINITY_DN2277_c0_g1_i1.p1 TRINITY_DN2277_c0_g1~~TRINITY_DN2277_c0_g1_i1.p1  ORF type:complete len:299 (+),score=93.43 TRINITY_DN2277_c0_g1_i1:90-986(+)